MTHWPISIFIAIVFSLLAIHAPTYAMNEDEHFVQEDPDNEHLDFELPRITNEAFLEILRSISFDNSAYDLFSQEDSVKLRTLLISVKHSVSDYVSPENMETFGELILPLFTRTDENAGWLLDRLQLQSAGDGISGLTFQKSKFEKFFNVMEKINSFNVFFSKKIFPYMVLGMLQIPSALQVKYILAEGGDPSRVIATMGGSFACWYMSNYPRDRLDVVIGMFGFFNLLPANVRALYLEGLYNFFSPYIPNNPFGQ